MKKAWTVAMLTVVLAVSVTVFGLFVADKLHTQEFVVNNVTVRVTYPTQFHFDDKMQFENGVFCGLPAQIVAQLRQYCPDTIFSYQKNMDAKRCYIEVSGHLESQTINQWLIQHFDIKADTIDSVAYVLDLHDAVDYTDGSYMLCTSELLVQNIRKICNIPVKPLHEAPDRVYKVPNLATKHNVEEMAELLRDKCQIELAQSDTASICLIRYH